MARRRSSKSNLTKRNRPRMGEGRRLHHETLEQRQLLAASLGLNAEGESLALSPDAPRLLSVSANSGELFRLQENNVLPVAPTELTLRFEGGQEINPATFPAIQIIGAGGDGSFMEGNERIIDPGFLGFEEESNGRVIVARFAQTLQDDQYRVRIAGFDDPSEGIVGLRNTDDELFRPDDFDDPDRPAQIVRFEVEVGAQVVSVVPQPIGFDAGGNRVQHRNQIHVFFNEDPLSEPEDGVIDTTTSTRSVVQPEFYNLFFTNDTVENTDDPLPFNPTQIEYDPELHRAVLTFDSDLADFAPDQFGTFRLRIGSSQPLPDAPTIIAEDPSNEVPGTFSGSFNLGANFGGNAESIVIRGEVEPTVNSTVRWPGIDSPGTRDNRRDPQVTGQPDTTDGINIYYYNFGRVYGTDPFGNVLENVITDAQKQRTREVLGLYSDHLGVQFIESEDRGLQIATGDLRTLVRTARTGQGEPLHEFRLNDEDPTQGILVLDGGENWYDGYGLSPDNRPSWFGEALRGIGSLLGIGHTFDQVPGVASGSSPELYNASLFPLPDGSLPSQFSIEPDFLSTSDIIAGQALHRPETRDVDLYRFDVAEEGRISIETFAERLDDTSLLDTDLKLWKLNPSSGQYVLVARNDDFFSNDSFTEIDVSPNADGTSAQYVIGITASGNGDYNPLIPGSGSGGRTEGRYELRVTFQDKNVETIVDTAGTALDGSGDGNPGGDFNFWFRTAQPKGTAAAGAPRTLFVDKLGADNMAGGDLDAPFRTIAFAFAQAKAGDIVRILPSAGGDGLLSTVADNRAYEIGRGGPSNAVLSDGETFNVPQGVTVMVDAGTLFKLRNAKVSVGSERIDEDRSLAALQILGAPILAESDGSVVRNPDGTIDRTGGHVIVTSYQDESIGVDTNPLQTSPSKGQWGGIEFRNDFDLTEGRPVWETEGIFLDYVSHADIRYGGGATAANRPVVNPLQMLEARPTLIYNTIRFSSTAAMGADPNSFEETNFHVPLFQRVDAFTSDYQRVGPDIRGNTLIDNSINGLFVRVRTPALGERTPMTVSGRFDDRDITHVLSETLVLQGQTGGALLLEDRPDVLNVSVGAPATPPGEGTLPVGAEIDYRLTFITARGRESLASLPTRRATVGNSGSLNLTALPQAPAEFAGRRLYRRAPASGDYIFVQQLDRNTTSFKDVGEARGGVLSDAALALGTDERLFPRFDARLSVDPGMVIKLDTARIEARFGADFYAEGLDGQPIVFTSPRDDTYGAGGTFDTNNDGSGESPQPGDWSGLVFRQGSTASLDHTIVSYAGGNSSVSGRLVDFNPVEILQADVRIANSLFSDNASGDSGGADFRDGIGFNGESTIFVRGAQPVILDNVIRDNLGAAISINPDALNYLEVQDRGRSTGRIARFADGRDNQGPLIVGNSLDNNSINGLLVRNEALTTESVWDDTDIVHVVERFVYAWNHHYRSGLRLKSDPDQSLVVKLQDGGALVADRYLNDVEDSIGGTIQVIGQPGFPVVLTSIHDDTVGAGFTAGGLPQTDTDNVDVTASPGDWHGIVVRAGANDRNVPFVLETEPAIPAAAGRNAIPSIAQEVGSLAREESNADENRRLGFNIRGTLSQNGDLDVYTFTANGQTEVYLDIDDTNFGLDSIVELIDINGNILAQSNDSFAESNVPDLLVNNIGAGRVLPLFKTGKRIIEGPNPRDAGMRVILPGNSNTENQYFVRVRSSNLAPGDPADKNSGAVTQGRSRGQYQLSIRLRETDEIAGSTVRLADIRYATDAIDVPASPFDSPLAAEAAERLQANGLDLDTGTSFSNNGALNLGSLNDSHRRVLRVSGTLGNNSTNFESIAAGQDIDVFRVDLFDDDQEPNIIGENRFVSAIFDLDYADQLGRANTRLSIFDADGRMILHGLDSNVADDQGRPRRGTDTANLEGGSVGKLDSYIGPVEMQVGTYYVVVSSAQMTPEALSQFFEADPRDTNVRMLPVNSVRRIAEEGFNGGTIDVNQFIEGFIDQDLNTTADIPNIVPLFDETSIVPYTLEDVRMFLTVAGGIGGGDTTMVSVDPFTGQLERTIGQFGPSVRDLGMRRDGELFAYRTDENDPAVTSDFLNISPINASVLSANDSGLTFQQNTQDQGGNEDDPNAVFRANAMAFVPQDSTDGARDGNVPGIPGEERLIVVGDRSDGGRGGEVHPLLRNNIAYSMVAATGAATNRGSTTAADRDFGDLPIRETFGPASDKFELGIIDVGQFDDVGDDPEKTGGSITGLAQNQGLVGFSSVFGVTDRGALYSFNPGDTRTVDVDIDPLLPNDDYNSVINTTFHGTVERDPLHSGSGAPEFSSITLGPRATEAGRYNNVFFATTTDGWIYTFQIDATGVVEPAPVLVHGRSAVPVLGALDQLGESGTVLNGSITGVAFSIREENPWHQTSARNTPFRVDGENSTNNLHGVFEPHDESRRRTSGGSSLYFGFDDVGLNNDDGETGNVAPGGSHGTTVSRPFSLEGVSSADKPTVYFNYFLEVQGDSDYSLTRQQLDSFRVLAAGDDGQWQLVSTSDSFRSFSNLDEYDDFRATDIPVQELHQNSGVWRQARVDLSALAGQKNVQLRFDFSTAGGMQSQFSRLRLGEYLIEIQAVPGTELVDGSSFSLRDSQAIPSGSPSTAFQFVRRTSTDFPDVEVLPNGRWPIYYVTGMSDVQVRESIRESLAVALGERDALGMSRATADHYPGYGTNRIRVFEQTLRFNNSAVGFSTFLPGDEFGSFGSTEVSDDATTGNLARHGGLNNTAEGVYIDDIVIGFASRGEMVLNAPQDRDFQVDPMYRERKAMTDDTQQPEFLDEILVGGYTVEVRGGAEYGVPDDFVPIRLELDEQDGLGRSFDVNDRLNAGAVSLIAPAGRDLLDGDTFVLSNGSQSLTFEFDSDGSVASGNVRVSFIPVMPGTSFNHLTDEPAVVAEAIRDAINSSQARGVLGITAAGGDSDQVGAMTGNRVELFAAEQDHRIRVNPSSGRFLLVDMVAAETPYGRESARTLPIPDQENETVDQDIFFGTFARAVVTDYTNGQTDTLVATGKIGDPVGTNFQNSVLRTNPRRDEDILKIFLREGDSIDVDLDAVGWNRGNAFATPRLEIYRDGATPVLVAASGSSSAAAGEAHRGALISGFTASEDSNYFIVVSSVPDFFSFFDPDEFGEYQLTVRPAGHVARDVLMVDYHMDHGDTNVSRPQGQLIIEANFISDFAGVGIRATYSGDQLQSPSASRLENQPGGVALLRNENSDRLLPGTVITNNVIHSGGGTGILFSGLDVDAGSPAPVPFGRIVNNTLVGSGSGTGIDVTNGASPTVLNNVVANFNVGLNIDSSSSSTEENFNTFQLPDQGNPTALSPQSRALSPQSVVIPAGESLFQDPGRDIFIPAAGAPIIDNSLSQLNDRATFVDTVKQPMGISPSPILAPQFDAFGIPRVADPTLNGSGGVGSNVFIDRGAIDRADFVQPVARLITPTDFIEGQGGQNPDGDADPSASFVRLPDDSEPLEFFEIQLLDPAGTGPDADTISAENVILMRDGVTLRPGVDYTFGYNDNNRLIRLTPLAGIWAPNAAYEITLNNRDRLSVAASEAIAIEDGDQWTVTDTSGIAATFEFDTGHLLEVPQMDDEDLDGIADVSDGIITYRRANGDEFRVELDSDGDEVAVPPADVVISYGETTTAADLASQLADAFTSSSLGLSSARALQDGLLSIGGAPGDTLDTGATGLTPLGTPGVTGSLQLSLLPDSDSDSYIGETLIVSDGTQLITYEFTLDDDTETDNRPIILESGQTAAMVTARLAQAIDADFSSLSPQVQNGTSLVLNESIGSFVDASGSSQISVSGVAGGAIPIPVSPSVDFSRDLVAAQLLGAISASPLRTTAFFAGNGTLLLDHALSVVDQDGVELHDAVEGITDLAGNNLQPNRSNAETQFTILMPGNELDFGDAPPAYEQGADGVLNPARHTLSDAGLPRLGQSVDADAGNPFPGSDNDDGLLIGSYEGTDGGITPGIFLDSDDSLLGFLNPHDTFGTELIVDVTGSGLLDAWVDFNQDGDWNDPGEQVFSNTAVLPGENRLRIQTPQSASEGETWMRLRLSPTGNQSPHGVVIGGEVEDYVVTVASVQLPVGVDDEFQVDEDTTLQPAVGVLVNDTLFGLLNPQVELESNVRFGTLNLELNADGEWEGGFSYTPDDQFYGTDTFTYRIRGEQRVDPNDPNSPLLPVRASQVGTVTITVNPVNDPPLVADHEFTTLEDIEGGRRITAAELLAGAAPGDFDATIQPPFDESAQSLQITGINDDPAVLEQLNDPPIVLDGDVEFTTTQGMRIVANFVDGALQHLDYFPTDDFNTNNPQGAPSDPFDSFTFTVYDDGVTVFDGPAETELDPPLRPEFSIGTVTLNVTPVNDPPTFTPGADVTVEENSGPYEQPWAANISPGPADEVAAGQTVRFEVDIDPADLSLFDEPPTISDDGTLRFTPALQANGVVPVDVRAIDSEGAVAQTVTLTINIALVPDPPVAVDDSFDVDEDTVLVLDKADVLANDSDPDLPNDELTIDLPNNTTARGATVTLDANNNIVYDPTGAETLQGLAQDEPLNDTFTYVLLDRFGLESDSATITMSVSGVNDGPQAVNDQFFVRRDRATVLDPLSNDFDIDGEIAPGSLRIVGQPGFGSVEELADGTLRYTPFAEFPGSDQFRYIVEDTLGAPSAEAIIRVAASPLQNPRPNLHADVNDSGAVTPTDALFVINYLNSNRPVIVGPDAQGPPFVDVDGNMRIEPLDALGVINVLNRQARAARSGEGEGAPVSVEMSTQGGVSAALQSGSHDALGVFNDLDHREAMPLDPFKTSSEDGVVQEIAPALQADSVDKLVGSGDVRIETSSSHEDVFELIARGQSDEDADDRTDSVDDLWRQFDRIE